VTTIYITKYWETQGILIAEAECTGSWAHLTIRVGNTPRRDYWANEWYSDEDTAIAQVEAMRKRRIKCIQKQLDRLQNMDVKKMLKDCRNLQKGIEEDL